MKEPDSDSSPTLRGISMIMGVLKARPYRINLIRNKPYFSRNSLTASTNAARESMCGLWPAPGIRWISLLGTSARRPDVHDLETDGASEGKLARVGRHQPRATQFDCARDMQNVETAAQELLRMAL